MRKQKVIMARLVPLHEADGSFDAEFWGRVGAEGRFAAMWGMVVEAHLLKGGDPKDLRLRKDVVRIRRRPTRPRRRACAGSE